MPRPPARWTAPIAALTAVAAGLASYAAFRPDGWWFAAPAAMGLLYLVLARTGPWRGFAVACMFGLAQFLPMLTWALKAAGWLPYLALCLASAALLALGAPLYGYARRLFAARRATPPDAVVFALAFTAADTFRQFFPFDGFPWGRLGFSQVDGPMARWAWLGGVPLVGLAAALAGPLVVAAVLGVLARHRRGTGTGGPGAARRWGSAAGAAALAGAVVAGPLALPVETAAEGGELKVGAVQGDVEVTSLGLFARQREVLENHVAGSRELAQEVGAGTLDVVLWPENSTDIDPRADAQAYAAIDSAALALGAPVLVGAMEYVGSGNRYNQGLLWLAGLGVADVYSKRHPAPFAEYMPARSFFRLFTSKVDLIRTDMLAGDAIGVLDLEAPALERTVALGDIICFEVAYDDIVAATVRAGAEVVVVQTNNASFGLSEEATQQFAMTRLRAIELGRSTVQISTVGVSAAVAADGSLITPLTGLFEPAYFTAELPLRTSLTPAALAGRWLAGLIMLLGAALAVAGPVARLAARRGARRGARR
ncbi:MAG: apolipoprotein N-acyltransferase [Bifidobacteriaceae bacterium]|jgi:apolipoprotein N-acyltransferase|nr:apolipoprotein N-acyltransferase [Bifidobacteriaceae bacterium]